MKVIRGVNVALRGVMEIGLVIGFGYWGYFIGGNATTRILYSALVPTLAFGFWGLVDFHQFHKHGEKLRLVQELVLTGLASVAFYVTGAHITAWMLALLSIVHHVLIYLTGDRLLKER